MAERFVRLVLVRRRRLALWVLGVAVFGLQVVVQLVDYQGPVIAALVLVSVSFGFVACWGMGVEPTQHERDRYRLAWLSARRRALLRGEALRSAKTVVELTERLHSVWKRGAN